ncbi:MAG: geranylgeranylglyceryl/heptaprenylglyceryl phosphate synthase [Candidatus Micrarchaeota archaeon]
MRLKVQKHIQDVLSRDGAMLFVLIDPVDHPSKEKAAQAALHACEGGADIILVGGSIGAQGAILDETTKLIKERVNVPVVLFPGNIATLTPYADAVYFMSLLNSRNPYWISQAQTLAAPIVKQLGIETLPVGYIVVEPGGTVGWVGDANLVPRDKPAIAASLALAGELMGSHYIITDVGSASKMGPVPLEMVSAVSKWITVPYIVAGGVRTEKQAKDIIAAGADIIQVGTAIEKESDVKGIVSLLSEAIKEKGRKKA